MVKRLQKKRLQPPSSLTRGEERKVSRVIELDPIYTCDNFVEEMIKRKVEHAFRLLKRYDV